MTVYRITLAKYGQQLFGAGTAGRWNDHGRLLIYSAGSVSLACLENLVHRSAINLKSDYSVMYIQMPESLPVSMIDISQLGDNWEQNYLTTKKLGNEWLDLRETCILQVPSAIIQGEFNFLINTSHPHFNQVQLVESLPFKFDNRLKS
jgi:RES domain-containing protein